MRALLAQYNGQRRKFKATFARYGQKAFKQHVKATLLLIDVIDVLTKEVATEHLWFTMGKKFCALGLVEGDIVIFEARVDTYLKGYIHDEFDVKYKDYHLVYPSKLTKIQVDPNQLLLTKDAAN
jgi:hypothetical protein